MKILVTGSKGQLGFDVIKELERRKIQCLGTDIGDFDITNEAATSQFISEFKPNAVIHCAAYTDVDKAEANPALCLAVNSKGSLNIVLACRKANAKMIYLSTDYVFPGLGDAFYEVDDLPNPLNIYGRSKLQGETAVVEILNNYFIVRTSWVFGLNGKNFIKKILELSETKEVISVISDQIGSPTYTVDLASLLCDMATTEKYGVYHATNEGICSWADFAVEALKQAGRKTQVKKICTAEYESKAIRPMNSRLSKKSLDEAGFRRLPDWRDAVKRYLAEIEHAQ